MSILCLPSTLSHSENHVASTPYAKASSHSAVFIPKPTRLSDADFLSYADKPAHKSRAAALFIPDEKVWDDTPELSVKRTTNDYRSHDREEETDFNLPSSDNGDSHCTSDSRSLPSQKVKKIITANKQAAETMLSQRFKSWAWITDWDKETYIVFADVIADGKPYLIYFDAAGEPNKIEEFVSDLPTDYDWETDPDLSPPTPPSSTPSRLQGIAEKYIEANIQHLRHLMETAAESGNDIVITSGTLPEERDCWGDICEKLNSRFGDEIPAAFYVSGSQIFVSPIEVKSFSPAEKKSIALSSSF